MKYNIQQLYDPNLPQRLNDFLNYLRTIKGKSENTIESYKLDLIMFLDFLNYTKVWFLEKQNLVI